MAARRQAMRAIPAAALLLLACACNLAPVTPTPRPATATPVQPLLNQDNLAGATALPAQVNPNCAATPNTWIQYVVEPGDSLGLLAAQTESLVADLVAGNCLDNPDQIEVGAVLFLPRQPVVSP